MVYGSRIRVLRLGFGVWGLKTYEKPDISHRFRENSEQLEMVKGPLPESQGQNLELTVLCHRWGQRKSHMAAPRWQPQALPEQRST